MSKKNKKKNKRGELNPPKKTDLIQGPPTDILSDDELLSGEISTESPNQLEESTMPIAEVDFSGEFGFPSESEDPSFYAEMEIPKKFVHKEKNYILIGFDPVTSKPIIEKDSVE